MKHVGLEMSRDTEGLPEAIRKHPRPSERTARFILVILGWLRDIFAPSTTIIPHGQVFQHHGHYLAAGKEIRYPQILLVEDNPAIARKFIEVIKNYYVFGTVKIFAAYAFDAAATFFANEDISLIIMDADLDDDSGDGADLTRKFIATRPEVTILANSSSRISNLKLTGYGAIETLGKRTDKLKSWLLTNDPTGAEG